MLPSPLPNRDNGMTTERPILFSGPMVRAILDGRKTQTRRVVKFGKCKESGVGMAPCEIAGAVNRGEDYRYCPYGQPGDRLWVRETWALTCAGGWAADPSTLTFRAGGNPPVRSIKPDEFSPVGDIEQRPDLELPGRWRPSIHMPRWACRLVLEVKAVRVERLQDISWQDARDEGVEEDTDHHRACFADLWNALNAKRGHGWDTNPWVWVIEFSVAQGGRDG